MQWKCECDDLGYWYSQVKRLDDQRVEESSTVKWELTRNRNWGNERKDVRLKNRIWASDWVGKENDLDHEGLV